MGHKNVVQKAIPVLFVFLMVLFHQPTKAHAWFFNFGESGHRDERARYTQVDVGSNRYYYNAGVFYSGDPGHYVAIDAPVGAIVYNVPSGYERDEIDGVVYYRYGDVYYRPNGNRYEVVRIDKSRTHGQNHWQGDDHRDNHQNDHRN